VCRGLHKAAKRSSASSAVVETRAPKNLIHLLTELASDPMVDQDGFTLAPHLATHKDVPTLLALMELSEHCADVVSSWVLGQGRSKLGEPQDYKDDAARQLVAAGVEWLYIHSPQAGLITSRLGTKIAGLRGEAPGLIST